VGDLGGGEGIKEGEARELVFFFAFRNVGVPFGW